MHNPAKGTVFTKNSLFYQNTLLSLLERGSTFLSSQLRTPQGTCFLRSLGPDLSIVEDGTENKFESSDMRYFIGKCTQSHQNRRKSPESLWKSENHRGPRGNLKKDDILRIFADSYFILFLEVRIIAGPGWSLLLPKKIYPITDLF